MTRAKSWYCHTGLDHETKQSIVNESQVCRTLFIKRLRKFDTSPMEKRREELEHK